MESTRARDAGEEESAAEALGLAGWTLEAVAEALSDGGELDAVCTGLEDALLSSARRAGGGAGRKDDESGAGGLASWASPAKRPKHAPAAALGALQQPAFVERENDEEPYASQPSQPSYRLSFSQLPSTPAKKSSTCHLCNKVVEEGDFIFKEQGAQSRFYPDVWSHSACILALRQWRVSLGLEQSRHAGDETVCVPGLYEGPAYRSPSEEQRALYAAVSGGEGHILVDAKAGSAKTTTMLAALSLTPFPRKLTKGDKALVLCFNKHNKVDLEREQAGCLFDAKTFNGAGWQVWLSGIGELSGRPIPDSKVVVAKKTSLIFKAQLPVINGPGGKKQAHPDMRLKPFVKRIVALAKCEALGVHCEETDAQWDELYARYRGSLERLLYRNEEGFATRLLRGMALARSTLRLSRDACYARVPGMNLPACDYDDQVYMPLWHEARHPGVLAWTPRPWVCVDEAQDLNTARKLLMHHLLQPGGRFLIVGDPFQSLYGFTGACSNSMRVLEQELHATRLPLSICWRCPKRHLAVAAALCSDPSVNGDELPIKPRPGAPEGTLLVDQTFTSAPVPIGGATVLCRSNAPLLQLFKSLKRMGWPARLVGGAGMCQSLKGVLDKALAKANPSFHGRREQLESLLVQYVARLHGKAARLGDDPAHTSKALEAEDNAECLKSLMEDLPEGLSGTALTDALNLEVQTKYGQVAGEAGAPFTLTLSTIHKAKGKEWLTVYLLQPAQLDGLSEALAGRRSAAQRGREAEGERCCSYVAATRSKDALVVLTHVQSGRGEPFDPATLLPEPSHAAARQQPGSHSRRRALELSQAAQA